MSLLDWNSIENSRHRIVESIKCTSEFNPLLLNEFVSFLYEVRLVSQHSLKQIFPFL